MPGHYFAYGANMSRTVFCQRRGMHPLASERARLDGYRLVFDLPGIPLVEPSFASIEPAKGAAVHGVLYRLDDRDMRLIRTYESPRYDWVDIDVVGAESGPIGARAFKNRAPVAGINPSRRYVRILCDGAREAGLPDAYIETLAAQPVAYVPVLSEAVEASWGALLSAARLLGRATRRRR